MTEPKFKIPTHTVNIFDTQCQDDGGIYQSIFTEKM